jgi:hypothetical protein
MFQQPLCYFVSSPVDPNVSTFRPFPVSIYIRINREQLITEIYEPYLKDATVSSSSEAHM